jgi:Na+-driven multidrug efflux pump
MTEVIGLTAALWPNAWLSLFASDPAIRQAGILYLHVVGAGIWFFWHGVGAVLRLAGRLSWPVFGNLARLGVAGGTWFGPIRWPQSVTLVTPRAIG